MGHDNKMGEKSCACIYMHMWPEMNSYTALLDFTT